MKHNICLLIPTLQVGGTEKQAVLLAKAFGEKYSCYLVVFYSNLIDEKIINLTVKYNIKVILLNGPFLCKLFRLAVFLKKEKISVIYSLLVSANFYGAVIGKLLKIDHIIGSVRNEFLPYKKLIVQKFVHNYLADITVFNNAKGRELFISKGFRPGNTFYIPNCIELNTEKIKRKDSRTINIITVARFVEQKKYETALRIIKELIIDKPEQVEIKYFAVGYGDLESELRSFAKEIGLEHIVNFIINPSDLSHYYKKADIYLSTSGYEGISNSILEAMSYSLPIVASDVGDNNLLIKNKFNGYLVEVKDKKGFKSCLELLIRDHSKRIEFGNNSYNLLKDKFTFTQFQKSNMEIIDYLDGKN